MFLLRLLEGMKERFSQLGIVSDFEFLVGEEADYEVRDTDFVVLGIRSILPGPGAEKNVLRGSTIFLEYRYFADSGTK